MIHPYKNYEKLETWSVLNKAFKKLVSNQDLSLTTHEEYVIGFICEELDKKSLLKKKKIKKRKK